MIIKTWLFKALIMPRQDFLINRTLFLLIATSKHIKFVLLWSSKYCLSIPRKCFSLLFQKSLLFNLTSKKASLEKKKLNFISTRDVWQCSFLLQSTTCLCHQKCFPSHKYLDLSKLRYFANFFLCNKLPPHLVSLRISSTFVVS